MSMRPWLRFFRFPNLPTVPGDALAGGAMALALTGRQNVACALFATSLVVLFAYMFGLADNDIAGAKSDATDAPERPIPAGEITPAQAKLARTTCLLALVLTAYFAKIAYIYPVVAALLATIFVYNRVKGFLLMGLCRGLGFLCGVYAVVGSGEITLSLDFYTLITAAFLAWTLFTAAITWLASDEHKAEAGMKVFRFIPGLAALIPLALFEKISEVADLVHFAVCLLAVYAVWVRAVLPLGKPHDPALRRRAVGMTIGALMFMQMAPIFAYFEPFLWFAIILLFIARFAIRRFQPRITGS